MANLLVLDALSQLSKELDDYWVSTTTSIGDAGGTYLNDTALYEKSSEWITNGMIIYLPYGPTGASTPETRIASTIASNIRLTPTVAFSAQVVSGCPYEVHRLFPRSKKLDAIRLAPAKLFPAYHKVIRDYSLEIVSGQYEYNLSSIGLYQNKPHQVLISNQTIYDEWKPLTAYAVDDIVRPSNSHFTGKVYQCTVAGISGPESACNYATSYQWYRGASDLLLYQTFTAVKSDYVDTIKVRLRAGAAGSYPFVLKLYATTGGYHTGTALATVYPDENSLTHQIDGELMTYHLTTPILLTASTVYAIGLESTTSSVIHSTYWASDTTGAYSGGKAYYNDGSNHDLAYDFIFEVSRSVDDGNLSEPNWITTVGFTITDWGVTWTCLDETDLSTYPMTPLHDWGVSPDGRLYIPSDLSEGYKLCVVGIKPLSLYSPLYAAEYIDIDSTYLSVIVASAGLSLIQNAISSSVGKALERYQGMSKVWYDKLEDAKQRYPMNSPNGTMISGEGLTV